MVLKYRVLEEIEPTGFPGMLILYWADVAVLPRGEVGGVALKSATTAVIILADALCSTAL